jgi:HSP20 family protein
MHASYENGVLTITIPVAERAKPRKVAVETPGQRTSIDAPSTPSTVEAAAR